MQSIVVVLLKVVLRTAATLANLLNGNNGSPSGPANSGPPQEQELHSRPGSRNGSGVTDGASQNPPEVSIKDLDRARTQEIMSKAVSAIFVLLLKWFKISRK